MSRAHDRAEARVLERAVRGPLDPLDCFQRLRARRPAVLLDGQGPPRELARRAYVLFEPAEVVRVPAGSDRERAGPDPLARLFQRLSARWPEGAAGSGGAHRFRGGAAGYLGYDVGRWLERVPAAARLESEAPDLWFGLFDRGLEIDLATGAGVLFAPDERGLDAAAERLAGPAPPAPPAPAAATAPLASNFSRSGYLAAVRRARELIRDGEIYQVNLAQRFGAPFHGDPFALYLRLRGLNPAPFGAFVDTGEVQLASSSPERFLSRAGERIETRPIKGTRRRSGVAEADARAVRELLASEKEAAELAMIVDLERNDLGRVAAVGSVAVESAGHLEAYATVFHRVAVVSARLDAGTTQQDLLRAAFPGGSVTGCPKIRAQAVIEELEPVRRGVFTGAIGWIGRDGDLDLSIAIRTIVLERGLAHFHVGGGIVYDSEPEAEYAETLVKGRALAEALGRGDDLPVP